MMKKAILFSLSILLLLAGSLFVHIWIMTDRPPQHLADTQLARIDMDRELQPAEASHLRNVVEAMPGVTHCYVNAAAGTLVYAYVRRQQTAEAVYDQVARVSPTGCERFVVSNADLQNSCPVMAHDGIYARLTAWVMHLHGRSS